MRGVMKNYRVIFLGPPGSGKGTQSLQLAKQLKVPQISTGDILRNEIKRVSPIGRQAEIYMTEGLLVPDDIILAIVGSRLKEVDCKNGFILDGFPRTVSQARSLKHDLGVDVDYVLFLDIPDDVLLKRLSGRRICSNCQKMFHIDLNPSAKMEYCDFCGGQLIIRDDDSEYTVAQRINVFREQTQPVIEFYQNTEGIRYFAISGGQDGNDPPAAIAERIRIALQIEYHT